MKKNMLQKPAFRLAFCAVIAALETVLMMAAGLFRVGTYALPCFAGLLSIAVVIEYKCKWALAVWFVTSVLAFFLSGDKEAVVLFIAFFGYYPILKNVLERHVHSRAPLWVLKFLIFNAAAVGSFYAALYLVGVSPAEFTLFGVYVPYVFLVIGNVFFLLYDLSIQVFVRFYVQRLRNKLFGQSQ